MKTVFGSIVRAASIWLFLAFAFAIHRLTKNQVVFDPRFAMLCGAFGIASLILVAYQLIRKKTFPVLKQLVSTIVLGLAVIWGAVGILWILAQARGQ